MTTTAAPTRASREPTPLEPALLTAVQAASYLGLSRSAIFEMRASQFVPHSISIGGKVLWRRAELDDWIVAGCPNCNAWRWEPTKIVSTEAYRESLKRSIARLTGDLEDINAAIARGEQTLKVRVR